MLNPRLLHVFAGANVRSPDEDCAAFFSARKKFLRAKFLMLEIVFYCLCRFVLRLISLLLSCVVFIAQGRALFVIRRHSRNAVPCGAAQNGTYAVP